MSASREKRKRKEQMETGGVADTKMTRSEINAMIVRNLIRVACVVAALALIVLILVGQGLPQRFIPAVTAQGQPITAAEFNIYYQTTLADFYNDEMVSMYVMYGLLDPDKPLHRQEAGEGVTWHDVVVEDTVNNIGMAVLWSEAAKAEGITYTDEDLELINDVIATAEMTAEAQGISLNKLLSNTYGRGVNEDSYRKFLERRVLADRYETHMYESVTITEQEINDRYNANKRDFDKVSYREFRVNKNLTEEEYAKLVEENGGEPVELNELVDSPIGMITYEHKLAYDKAAAFINDPDLTEESFNDIAARMAPEDAKEWFDDPDFTLKKNASYGGEHEGADHDHDDSGHNDEEIDPEETYLNDWLFASARKHGDKALLDDGDTYVAALFLERVVEDDLTVSFRQILISPAGDDDEAWDEAEAKARELVDGYDGGEQGFIDLVKIHSADHNTKNTGGLYESMRRSFFDEDDDIGDWLFDPSRSEGDIGILRGPSSVHIFRFSEWDRPFWQINVEGVLRNERYNAMRMEKASGVQRPNQNWLGMRLIARG